MVSYERQEAFGEGFDIADYDPSFAEALRRANPSEEDLHYLRNLFMNHMWEKDRRKRNERRGL